MKNFIFLFLLFLKFTFIYSQETTIKWSDKKGRTFEVSAPSGSLTYGILAGDNIEYGSQYSDNHGKVTKIGDVLIEYSSKYSDFPGKVIKIGSVRLEYGSKYSDNPGKLLRVGNARINYASKYSDNPGRIVSVDGNVLPTW
jgi:hypothetical protein